jgi:DUF4097 and DUF4098 domain-containing protein YvlB
MKNNQGLATVFVLALMLGAGALSAQGERIVVPLSDPGRPAVLEVSVMTGSISVSAYDGAEIVVVATMEEDDHEVERRDGMMRIPNSSVGLTIEERNNHVSIDADWSANSTRLEIQVPATTSLKLNTVNGGDIEVAGVSGVHELQNVNGGISALDMSGSVVAATTNGDVRVQLVTLDADTPMSFSTWNGDVDLTVPASTGARLHLNSGRGDIFTDMDVALEPIEAKVSREEGKGSYRVRVEKEVVGTINGGGPDFRMKTFNGSIYVRKAGG